MPGIVPGNLPQGTGGETAAAHQLAQPDAVEEGIQLVAQFTPQIMGQAPLAVVAVLPAVAFGDVEAFIHRNHDIGHADKVNIPGQHIAPARPARAHNQGCCGATSQKAVPDRTVKSPGFLICFST